MRKPKRRTPRQPGVNDLLITNNRFRVLREVSDDVVDWDGEPFSYKKPKNAEKSKRPRYCGYWKPKALRKLTSQFPLEEILEYSEFDSPEEFCEISGKESGQYNHARHGLDVVVGGIPIEAALLDEGSTHTVLPYDIVPELRSRGYKFIPYKNRRAGLANDSSCKVLGHITVPIHAGTKGKLIDCDVLQKIPQKCILGIDFQRAMRMTIRFGDDRCFVEDENGEEELPLVVINSIGIKEDEVQELPTECHLTEEQKQHFAEWFKSWVEKLKASPGRTKVSNHTIYLKPGTVPIKQKVYNVPPSVQANILKELDRLLEEDCVEESNSSWSSPIVLVNKSNGRKRLCIDFRKVNDQTIKSAYPSPDLNGILHKLKGANYVSKIDLRSGFHQIPLSEDSKPITAFSVPGRGLFQYKVMPFGITNAPGSFQQLMEIVLRKLMDKGVFIYIDDILVIGATYEEHIELLDQVFLALLNAGLSVNWEKSVFLKPYVMYLGFVVGQGKILADYEKVKSIAEALPPRNPKGVRSFIGMCSWYRRFIQDFSTKAKPLMVLLEKGRKWHWGDEQQKAFETLKRDLIRPPILYAPDFDYPFEIHCDSSHVGLGGVLLQRIDDQERVISFISRSFTKPERNYSTTEKELLAIIHCVETCRPFIEGSEVTVVTDHSALRWLKNIKNPTGRLARWALRLSVFNLKVVHRKGKYMCVPDALSRLPYNDPSVIEELEEEHEQPEVSVSSVDLSPVAMPRALDFGLTTDVWYRNLRANILANPDSYRSFEVRGDKIFKIFKREDTGLEERKLVVPTDFRDAIMESFHSTVYGGHLGFEKTYSRIKQKYYWSNMSVDIKFFVAKCERCVRYKPLNRRPAGYMRPYMNMLKPGSTYSMDFVGPLPLTRRQNRFILVLVDLCTKWVVAVPVRNKSSQNVVKVIENEIIAQFGRPDLILTDNAKEFNSRLLDDYCEMYGIKLNFIPNYYPQANPTEAYNKTVERMIAMFAEDDHRSWDVELNALLFALRTTKNDSTGYSPAFLTYGRELSNPYDVFRDSEESDLGEFDPQVYADTLEYTMALTFKKVLDAMEKGKHQQADRYNASRREVHFKVGDSVLKRNHPKSNKAAFKTSKFEPKWVGPFTIAEVLSPSQYRLKKLNGRDDGLHHVSDLKPNIASVGSLQNLGERSDLDRKDLASRSPAKTSFAEPMKLEDFIPCYENLINHSASLDYHDDCILTPKMPTGKPGKVKFNQMVWVRFVIDEYGTWMCGIRPRGDEPRLDFSKFLEENGEKPMLRPDMRVPEKKNPSRRV